ncbi:YceI family protein [Luteirhabdus pelagi]|jgi:polyisoprenoid-binding protein YceI|uniref:YceI family protein n=1 Tax=Luteirhabdus pelagi TaxID=2792783 RepID=UPI00193ABCA3|nr:YceI family protein [Luteirhabdus pelagi]MCT8338486.1 YceI family protein [Thermobacterium salinum]
MRKTIKHLALALIIATGAVSCKEGAKEAETSEAQEAAEASDMAVNYSVDTDNSRILWEGSKPTGKHNGYVMLSSGEFSMKDDMIEAGKFEIDMNTITDEDLEGEQKTNLENHLKGTVEGKETDFFNVKEYPTANFELTGMNQKKGKTIVSGNLTIKDQTHNIQFPATLTNMDDKIRLESEPFAIDRTKWNVNYGSKSVFDDLGDKFISDDMVITINLTANKTGA